MNVLRRFLRVDKHNVLVTYSVVIAFMVGVFLIVVKTPFSWFDEIMHVARAIQLSNGDVKVIENGNPGLVGGYLSENENAFYETVYTKHTTTDVHYKLGWWTADEYKTDIEGYDGKVFRAVTNTVPYTPLCYFPYIAVALFSHFVNLSPIYEYLLMRIFGFLIYIYIYIYACHTYKLESKSTFEPAFATSDSDHIFHVCISRQLRHRHMRIMVRFAF